jgi:hypothetical protein
MAQTVHPRRVRGRKVAAIYCQIDARLREEVGHKAWVERRTMRDVIETLLRRWVGRRRRAKR